MPKSKHRKKHQERLNSYKANKKKEQELLKKKMIDNYIKMQQENLANKESHSSVEEVSGPEVNIDELNAVEELTTINEVDVNVDVNVDEQWTEVEVKEFDESESLEQINYDNNNK